MAIRTRAVTSAWSGLRLVSLVEQGNRNEVWRGELDGRPVSVRQSRRSDPSLAWELDLLARLDTLDFVVPTVVPADDGARHVERVVVQNWIEGEPPVSMQDWARVAAELRRLHAATTRHSQRPDCCAVRELHRMRQSVDADLDVMPQDIEARVTAIFAALPDLPTSVVHGDPDPSNIRMTVDGRVGLLDWDESRVDVAWHDLSNLGIQVLGQAEHVLAEQLSNAWEAANAWIAEPSYARDRLGQLVDQPET